MKKERNKKWKNTHRFMSSILKYTSLCSTNCDEKNQSICKRRALAINEEEFTNKCFTFKTMLSEYFRINVAFLKM